MNKYYNKITKQNTNCEYRFKTEEEFIKDYGEEWYKDLPSGISWIPQMNPLFGQDLKKELIYKDYGVFSGNGNDRIDDIVYLNYTFNVRYGIRYNITEDMFKKNSEVLDYNKPKQLVYESSKVNDYDVIAVKINSQDEYIKIQKFAFSKGYSWYNGTCISNSIDTQFLLLKHGERLSRMTNDESESGNIRYIKDIYPSNIIVNGLSELRKIYKPKQIDYNKPRQLVYEKHNIGFSNIIYKCINENDFKEMQKIAFKNGFIWYNTWEDDLNGELPVDEIREYPIDDCLYITIDTNSMDMLNNSDNIKKYELDYGDFDDAIVEIYGRSYITITNSIDLKRILTGKMPSSDMYNKPKQLIYEKVNKNYGYYIKTEDELINEYGEDWSEDINACWNSPNMDYLFGSKLELKWYEKYLDEYGNLNDSNEDIKIPTDDVAVEDMGGHWLICRNLIKKVVLTPDYNSPKQLIYESVLSDKYNTIIFKCNTDQDVIKSQELLFKNGYKWANDSTIVIFSHIDDCEFIFIKNNTKLLHCISGGAEITEDNIKEIYITNNKDNLYINDYNELFKLFHININYNSPRQLVYENKIIKFNNYKNVL